MAHGVEHAAALEAARILFVDEVDRHRDGDRRMLGDAEEVDMHGAIRHRMELHVLRQRAGLAAADVDHHDRIHEVAGAQHLDQVLLFDVDRKGFQFLAVHDGGDAALVAQCAGGSLASPITRFGRQRKLLAHGMSPNCGFKKNPDHASRDDHERGSRGL
jgi:hypothetical protein